MQLSGVSFARAAPARALCTAPGRSPPRALCALRSTCVAPVCAAASSSHPHEAEAAPSHAHSKLPRSSPAKLRPEETRGHSMEARAQEHDELWRSLRKMSAEAQGFDMYSSHLASHLASQDPADSELQQE